MLVKQNKNEGESRMSNAEMVYEDLIARGKQEYTAIEWRRYVKKFEDICGVKDVYDRGDVVKFLAELRKQGYKQNSINTIVRPVKLLAQIQGWDYPSMKMPRVKAGDISRKAYGVEEIGNLIRRAKETCSDRQLAYLAVASVYGCRREEVGTAVIDGDYIVIKTVKGGDTVRQLIPDEIKPYLVHYEKRTDVRNMTRTFHQICKNVGVQNGESGFGWHSIRRALATELVITDVSALNILRFMRWSDASLKGEFGMLIIYAKRNQEAIDEAVFKVHPFLKYWRDGGDNEESIDVDES